MVVVVGNSLSGQDISMELVNVAKEVHLSSKYPDNISQGLSKVISKHANLHIQPQVNIELKLLIIMEENHFICLINYSWS